MNYVASASNNSEDLIGSDSDKILDSSTNSRLNQMETAKQTESRDIDNSSSGKKQKQ